MKWDGDDEDIVRALVLISVVATVAIWVLLLWR